MFPAYVIFMGWTYAILCQIFVLKCLPVQIPENEREGERERDVRTHILTCASAYVLGRIICRIVLVGISECMAVVICLIFVPSKSIHFSTSGGNHWKKSNRTPTASNRECNWAASSNLHEGTLSSSCGARESKPSRAKAVRKLRERRAPRSSRESSGESRWIVETHSNIYVAAKAKTVPAKAGAKRLEPLRYPVFDTAHNRQSHKFISTVNSLDNCQTKIVKKWAVMSLKIAFTQSIVGIMVQTGVSNFIAAIIAKSFLMTSSTALSTSWPAPTTRSTRSAGVGVVDILLQDEMRCPNGAKQDIVAHSAILCKISFMRWNRGMLDPPDIWAQNVWRIIYVDICWPTENTVCWNQLQL